MDYRATVINRECSVLVYDHTRKVNFIGSCQVMICGKVGFIHTVDGPRFYAAMRSGDMLRSLMKQIGLTTLEAEVIPAHERLMARSFRGIAMVEVIGPATVGGVDGVRVRITPCH